VIDETYSYVYLGTALSADRTWSDHAAMVAHTFYFKTWRELERWGADVDAGNAGVRHMLFNAVGAPILDKSAAATAAISSTRSALAPLTNATVDLAMADIAGRENCVAAATLDITGFTSTLARRDVELALFINRVKRMPDERLTREIVRKMMAGEAVGTARTRSALQAACEASGQSWDLVPNWPKSRAKRHIRANLTAHHNGRTDAATDAPASLRVYRAVRDCETLHGLDEWTDFSDCDSRGRQLLQQLRAGAHHLRSAGHQPDGRLCPRPECGETETEEHLVGSCAHPAVMAARAEFGCVAGWGPSATMTDEEVIRILAMVPPHTFAGTRAQYAHAVCAYLGRIARIRFEGGRRQWSRPWHGTKRKHK
jgi:hypothetical protein